MRARAACLLALMLLGACESFSWKNSVRGSLENWCDHQGNCKAQAP